jgi:hypothetical protein
MESEKSIVAIFTDIGRGHPNYLDSVLRHIRQNTPECYKRIQCLSVIPESHGISKFGWHVVKILYQVGSRGGRVSAIYSGFRKSQSVSDRSSLFMGILRRDLLRQLSGFTGKCLVAHPVIAAMLKERHRVFYLHGEIAAPLESAVAGLDKIYVPISETGDMMVERGVDVNSVKVTGLILEPELSDDVVSCAEARVRRINDSDMPLQIGFFISGAYPSVHVDSMIRGAVSCDAIGLKVRFFWGTSRRQVKRLLRRLRKYFNAVLIDDTGEAPAVNSDDVVVVTADDRESETISSLRYLPSLDVICAAPHERTNWAVGAGLPMIAIVPPVGTFAPQNLEYMRKMGCCKSISTREEFDRLGDMVLQMRTSGRLETMVQNGLAITSINGAQEVALDLFADQM